MRAKWFKWGRGRLADFFLRPPTLKAGNFEALQSLIPIFIAFKVLNPLKRYLKNQEASCNFKLGFALSKRLHFNSVYLVRVLFLTGIAVFSRWGSWFVLIENGLHPFCGTPVVAPENIWNKKATYRMRICWWSPSALLPPRKSWYGGGCSLGIRPKVPYSLMIDWWLIMSGFSPQYAIKDNKN